MKNKSDKNKKPGKTNKPDQNNQSDQNNHSDQNIQPVQNNQPGYNIQDPLLSLFHDNFGPIIELSRNIIIRPQIMNSAPGKDHFQDIMSCSVSGFTSPDELWIAINTMVRSSLAAVSMTLKGSPRDFWHPHLEYIRQQLKQMESIVDDESFIKYDGPPRSRFDPVYKSFTHCRLEGFAEDHPLKTAHWIRRSIDMFARAWLDAFNEAMQHVDLVPGFLSIHSPGVLPAPGPSDPQSDNSMIRLSTSVPHLACLCRILYKFGIIDLHDGNDTFFIRWLIKHVQSRNCESITFASMRKHFFSPTAESYEFLIKLFKDAIDYLEKKLDHLSR